MEKSWLVFLKKATSNLQILDEKKNWIKKMLHGWCGKLSLIFSTVGWLSIWKKKKTFTSIVKLEKKKKKKGEQFMWNEIHQLSKLTIFSWPLEMMISVGRIFNRQSRNVVGQRLDSITAVIVIGCSGGLTRSWRRRKVGGMRETLVTGRFEVVDWLTTLLSVITIPQRLKYFGTSLQRKQ